MVPRFVRAAYYAMLALPMRFNGWLHRCVWPRRKGVVRAHLGPGPKKYLPGWVNVDANLISARPDIWADLRNRLPFRDGSVDAFYSHHVIEHLPDVRLAFHFREMARCLKPGGRIRVGGPHGDNAVRKLIEEDAGWFTAWPDDRKSVGGRFVNFIFLRNEHLTMLTASYLDELATDAGLVDVVVRKPGETGHPGLFADVLAGEHEKTPDVPHTLLIEARKPE